ncbi:LacI family DNA-binding transcriptional regulator [Salinisphaera sp.]|uniref:LacI family DNA-binding transcriptional regulator n=1 Tax=Salinisphaera sp. TaxID=1914330 RepID=UPI002D76EEE7|nr:LacI family DNA-binding transcriptional regulator [Salinisphaera sp.]HET7315250.1 LacI family DNA-binding transcriptional regulator [Salinisphaera sp.]
MSDTSSTRRRNAMRTRSSASPTIGDVARAAGVSTATVSRILNGVPNKATDITAQRVHDAVEKLRYRPVQAGRSLSMMRSAVVALLTPDNRNAFYASIADAVQRGISATGNAMTLCNTREDPASQDAYIEEMRSHLVSGIVLLGAVRTPGLERLLDDGPPVVFVNRKCPVDSDSPFVGIDNYGAGRDVARYFLDKGYVDCAALHGPCMSSASRERFEGFRDAMAAAGAALAGDRIVECDLTIESGYRQSQRLFERGQAPRAVFCGNDPIAYGLHRRCQELKFRVPDDIAIFGFDDNPLNEWLAPWLSTVHVPLEELGRQVSDVMRRLLEGSNEVPARTVLAHTLTIRSSA